MKKLFLLFLLVFVLTTNSAYSQTMKVQSKSGDKTYNVSDVESITFGKTTNGFIEMVEIPAGTFQMGQISEETPVHTVNITKAYYIGKYEVTQKQYTDIIGTNPSNFTGNDNNPVEKVNWYDAIQFCNELSKKEGLEPCYTLESGTNWLCDFNKKGYRLPTEAEWEYACRAGTITDHYTGTSESQFASAAWYGSNSDSITHPVGQKVANNFGLYDMHGNVWEWCWDWYSDYEEGTFDDPTGPNTGSWSIIRGGSWLVDMWSCRSARRNFLNSVDAFYDVGFRVVRTK
jgi:formylglycine-generating enzyme required for sulfatase activity